MNVEDSKFSVQPEYLVVQRPPNYVVNLRDQAAELEGISAACKAADRRKVLILGSDTGVRLSFTDIYDLGEEIARLGLRIAVVEDHDASDEDVDFLETVALNRGGSLRFFNAERDAKDWLGVA